MQKFVAVLLIEVFKDTGIPNQSEENASSWIRKLNHR